MYLPIIHLVFADLKTSLNGIRHGSVTSTCKPTSTNSPPLQQAVLAVQRPRKRWAVMCPLCAMAVPAEGSTPLRARSMRIARSPIIRTHACAQYVVVLTAERPEQMEEVAAAIEAETGMAVHRMPKLDDFFISFGVEVSILDPLDRRIVAATPAGLPLVAQPYHVVAEMIGTTEAEMIARLERMLPNGAIRRIGAVPNHSRSAFRQRHVGVGCRRREDHESWHHGRRARLRHPLLPAARHLPLWPYNCSPWRWTHARRIEDKVGRIAALISDAARANGGSLSTAS